MRNAKRAGMDWTTPETPFQWEHVRAELLMDIRDELKKLNALLHCTNFVTIPTTLRSINRKLAKPKEAR